MTSEPPMPDNELTPHPPATPLHWHALEADAVCARLETSLDGLSEDEARRRLAIYGANRLRPPQRRGPLRRLLAQFNNVLIYVLLIAAGMTAFLQHWIDTGVILGVVIINALIGFIQEGKAEKSLEAIRRMLSHYASVRRDGRLQPLEAELLVPGDIVQLKAGDKVPADIRLLQVRNLRIDEAALTGESVPVAKQTTPVAEDAPLGDRSSMAYSGTLVTYGQGLGVVVATGQLTEIGRISSLLEEVQTLTTPLLREMDRFGRWLSGAILAVAALTFGFGVLFRDYAPAEMFLAAVGVAVAAIPEGLPAIMTITLALGVQRMARRHAIIRRLPAVETLGSVTVICSDKTGTLTRNEMTVQGVTTAGGLFTVSGSGYDPHGDFLLDGQEIELDDYPVLAEIARVAILCNDAVLLKREDGWTLDGDPTEGALLTLGLKAGLEPQLELELRPRSDVIPFESEHQFMATLHHDHEGHGFIYVKGAPERILAMCRRQRSRDGEAPLDTDYWQQQMNEMARRGQRLLAMACRDAAPGQRTLNFEDIRDLTLLGIVGMIDPPRPEAITAVQRCRQAGIRVKMITGDHAVTAAAIGTQLGIGDGETVLAGHELDTLEDGPLREAVQRVDVFARATPENKLRIVEALQAQGEVVAMTGDGVNDAPALKRADVGIAMGQKGTQAAREAAEMVLADDNFASIANAVEEGRTVFDNLRKAILFILPTNGGEALTIIAAIAMGRLLPITPVQILWVNMITAVTLALALAFEPPEPHVMQRPPRDPRQPLLTPLFIWRIVYVAAIMLAGTFGLFAWERQHGADIDFARTVAVNTLVLFEMFYLFNSRFLTDPVLTPRGLFGNPYVLGAILLLVGFQLAFTYWGPLQQLFQTAALDADTWLRILAVTSSVLFLVEIEKAVVRSWQKRRAGQAGQVGNG